MSRFLDAVEDQIRFDSDVLSEMIDSRYEMSDAFFNIVTTQGEARVVMSLDDIALVREYYGVLYFERWLSEEEITPELIKHCLHGVVNNTDFSNLE